MAPMAPMAPMAGAGKRCEVTGRVGVHGAFRTPWGLWMFYPMEVLYGGLWMV